jgi:hypothetical protein
MSGTIGTSAKSFRRRENYTSLLKELNKKATAVSVMETRL